MFHESQFPPETICNYMNFSYTKQEKRKKAFLAVMVLQVLPFLLSYVISNSKISGALLILSASLFVITVCIIEWRRFEKRTFI